MKYIFLISLVLSGCDSQIPNSTIVENGKGCNVIKIDGCEYIEVDEGILSRRVYSLTHKGNCKNPIHNVRKD